ncbi:MAG: carboxypeptidase regulatory-like domain-containing protein [bacterium]
MPGIICSGRAKWVILIPALMLSGCSEDGPALFPVEGVVKLDGKPLANAELTFAPDPSNPEPTAGSAMTSDDGTYKARYQARFGLAVGNYKVAIRKVEITDGAKVPEAIKGDPTQMEMMGAFKQKLPDKYAALDKTSFMVEVKTEGNKAFDFELDSKGR